MKNGKIQPTLTIRTSDKNEDYTIGMRRAIPEFMSYSINPREIKIDLISEKFNTEIISDQNINSSVNNLIQFGTEEDDDVIYQFNITQFNPLKKNVSNIKVFNLEYEERLFLNLKKGFIFSLINSDYKLTYCYARDFQSGLIGHLHSDKDYGALSRFQKYWTELEINTSINDFNIEIFSNTINQLFNNQNSGVFYIFHKFKSNHIWVNIPYLDI
jgi:hypothetical protein